MIPRLARSGDVASATIIYRAGQSVVRDGRDRLQVSAGADRAGVLEALRPVLAPATTPSEQAHRKAKLQAELRVKKERTNQRKGRGR